MASDLSVPRAGPPQKGPTPVDEFLTRIYDNELVREQVEIISKGLDDLHPASPADRERVLLKSLAAAYVSANLERIYHTIYGSQLAAVQYLNMRRDQHIKPEDLRDFYDEAAKRFPSDYAHDTYERWLSYLTSMTLAKVEGAELVITLQGVEFLKYITGRGYVTLKPR